MKATPISISIIRNDSSEAREAHSYWSVQISCTSFRVMLHFVWISCQLNFHGLYIYTQFNDRIYTELAPAKGTVRLERIGISVCLMNHALKSK